MQVFTDFTAKNYLWSATGTCGAWRNRPLGWRCKTNRVENLSEGQLPPSPDNSHPAHNAQTGKSKRIII